MMPTSILKDEIDGVEFQVTIAPNVKVCKLYIDGDDVFVSDVDLAQVIRAIINSDDLYDVREAMQGIWRDDVVTSILNSYIGGVDL